MKDETRALRGIGVSSASLATARVITALLYLWVVAVLSPDQVGIVALGLLFYGILSIFKDFGLTAVIVTRKIITAETLNHACSIRFVVACILGLAGVASAVVAPVLYGEMALRWMLIIISLTIILEAFGFLPYALLQRDLEFVRLAWVDIVSVSAMAIAVAAAIAMGYSLYSLFIGTLMSSLSRTVMLVAIRPTPFGFRLRGLSDKSLLSFGGKLATVGVVSYLFLNLNAFVLGKVDIYALGLYSLAFLWASTPADIAQVAISRVMLPTYASLRRRNKPVIDGYVKTIRHLSIVAFGGFLVLFTLSPFVIRHLYGAVWEGSIPILLVLLVFGLCRTLLEPAGNLLVSVEKPGIILGTNLINLATMSLVVLPVSERFGALGCAVALTAVYLTHMLVVWAAISLSLKARMGEVAILFMKPFIASAGALTVYLVYDRLTQHSIPTMAIAALVPLIYAAVLYFWAREDFLRSISSIRRLFRVERDE